MSAILHILVLGPFPADDVKGGVASVINSHLNSPLSRACRLSYMATSSTGNATAKAIALVRALLMYPWILFSQRVDCVHIHTASWRSFWRKSVFVLSAKAMRRPVVLHIHGGQFEEFHDSLPSPARRLLRWVLDLADALVVLSPRWRPVIGRLCSNPEIHVVLNCVDASVITPSGKPSSGGTFKLLFLGGITRAKGVDVLLEALYAARAEVPHLETALAGTGDIPDFKAVARSLGLEDSVQFPGWVAGSRKIKMLQEYDVLVLPSLDEGLPICVLEAMSAGRPVIATPVGGVPDLIEDGVHGCLVPVGDSNALALAIIRLATRPDDRREMGATNRSLILDRYDSRVIADQLLVLYNQVISGIRT